MNLTRSPLNLQPIYKRGNVINPLDLKLFSLDGATLPYVSDARGLLAFFSSRRPWSVDRKRQAFLSSWLAHVDPGHVAPRPRTSQGKRCFLRRRGFFLFLFLQTGALSVFLHLSIVPVLILQVEFRFWRKRLFVKALGVLPCPLGPRAIMSLEEFEIAVATTSISRVLLGPLETSYGCFCVIGSVNHKRVHIVAAYSCISLKLIS
jgi:hypothetical protein